MTARSFPLLRAKYRIADNFVREIRSHLWIHLAAGLFAFVMVLVGGLGFFWVLFSFLLAQEPFGVPLMERLVGVVLLAFFSMLIFSNLIITLTTTYISKETEFLMAFPLTFRSLFAVKLAESVIYSSWAFALLSLPLFAAYGMAKHAPLGFYPAAALLAVPFLVIPAALGALVTMVLSACLPARRARAYAVALLVAALAIAAAIVRLMGLRSMILGAGLEDFSQIMAFLQVGTLPLLPNAWLARGLQAASEGQWADTGYWFLCLLSTSLMSVQICLWLAPRLYYRGWSLAKESATSGERDRRGWSPFPCIDRLFAGLTPPVRALLSKDIRTFWRDPAQWSQLVILLGLLTIYIANIRGLTAQTANLGAFLRHWPTILSFFNIGATCFVLSILTTRFIYPLLSLEGKQYWVVGLAPFPKQKLIWEKWALCAVSTVTCAFVLISFSNTMLRVSPGLMSLGTLTAVILGLGLTSLAVGLGAVFPNFREDNPARIANGLGGTLNTMASLAYIAANLALEIPPALHLAALDATGVLPADIGLRALLLPGVWPYVLGFVAVNALVIVLPMRIGIRRWVNLEFHL